MVASRPYNLNIAELHLHKKYGYVMPVTPPFCYMVQAFIDYLAMKKVAPEAIYNMKFVFCLSVVVTANRIISNLVYDYSNQIHCNNDFYSGLFL